MADSTSVPTTEHSASARVTLKYDVGGRFSTGMGRMPNRLLDQDEQEERPQERRDDPHDPGTVKAVRHVARLADEEVEHELADVLAASRDPARQVATRQETHPHR